MGYFLRALFRDEKRIERARAAIEGGVFACYNKTMFFIGVFGIEDDQKEIMTINNVVCPACGQYTRATLWFSYTFFHFFFIPTFKWNKRYFVRLECCGAVYECGTEAAEEMRRTGKIDFSKGKRQDSRQEGERRCPACGSPVHPGFSYCPYCGGKL